ncbi:MAG: GreA/GreB family elongation factor [Parachlamydiaceae bacterium]
MSYLKEIQTQINNRDFHKFMQLWEEYCASDVVDIEEFLSILKAIKLSDFGKLFGAYVETALPLLDLLASKEHSYSALKLLVDLQTQNSPKLSQLILERLQERYGSLSDYNEKLRLIGIRGKETFQGALSNFDLLVHAVPGNFVFHGSGWGTGEIMEVSKVREQLVIEFENVAGRKYVTFTNAFKTLIPLSADHFLARRFADPDLFEKQAKENPVEIIKILLRDLGPKTAAEIKDELEGLVIPEEDWQKWWQNTRAKLKKDTLICSPDTLKDPFQLRTEEVAHEDQFYKILKTKTEPQSIILACYNFVRDYPAKLKIQETKQFLKNALESVIAQHDLSGALRIQALFCLETVAQSKKNEEVANIILAVNRVEDFIDDIGILAYKKQAIIALKQHRQDWAKLFIDLLLHLQQSPLRDFLLKELNKPATRQELETMLRELIVQPSKQPDLFVWYFQKVMEGSEQENLPFSDKEHRYEFMESFLLLLNQLENIPSYRELTKRMYNLFSAKRYSLVRKILNGSPIDFAKEFLLLVSKCHTLSDHDLKILRSLAEVAHPSLKDEKARKDSEEDYTIWTSEEGYKKVQEKIKHIGTKEIVENAREIEAARALGDLRENSEYKFALEKKGRLQAELKMLSDQFSKARIITPDDIHPEEISVGHIVEVKNANNETTQYKILGPWDANPDQDILSYQSKLAQSMIGLKVGESFTFRDEQFKVVSFKSIFD